MKDGGWRKTKDEGGRIEEEERKRGWRESLKAK